MASPKQSLQTMITERLVWDAPTRALPLIFYLSIASHPRPELIGTRNALPNGTSLFIGRTSSGKSAGVFDYTSVSRRHARVVAERGGLRIEDLGSHNGTTINGEPCAKAKLSPGDVIGIGPVLLVVHQAPVDYAIPEIPGLVGTSYALASVLADVPRVAPFPKINVLLRGETGTGKELVARAIHEASGRPGKLQSVNCATLTGALLQSEIFGHEEGAFTDAKSARPGLIEAAHQGTLFLDEIGDATMDLQVSLLRFLETGETRRLGSDTSKEVDVRVIAASNLDLEELIRERRFREELFSRLTGWVIHMPKLRDRVEDIPLIAAHFVRSFAGKDIPIHGRLMRALLLYTWPQNVRELKSVIERAVIEANGEAPIPLSPYLERALAQQRRRAVDTPAKTSIEDRARPAGKPSREQLLEILATFKGNVRKVAVELAVSRNTIYRWCEEYGIDPDQFRRPASDYR
jgi:DNA-binding NtrC family response regulator